LFIFSFALLLYGVCFIDVHEDSVWMDPQTRTEMRQSKWFGIRMTPVITKSALDDRLSRIGFHHQPNWQFLHDSQSNVFGVVTVRGCSTAPRIYSFPPEMLRSFVNASSDQDIKNFMHIMQSGTEFEQNAAIESAADQALRVR